MKIKLDENVPHRIIALLESGHHDVATVVQEGLGGRTDETNFEAAKIEGRMILTLDNGFSDIRRYPPGSHPGIVVVRLPNQRPAWWMRR